MKKYIFFVLFILSSVYLISCDPSPTSGIDQEIPDVKWEISESQRKDVYSENETVTLKFSFPPDFEKFENYKIGFSIYPAGSSQIASDSIVIEPSGKLTIDNTYEVIDSKISIDFTVRLQKKGNYNILTSVYGNPRKKENYNYLTWKYIFFTVG